ncbi:MAG: acyltransferase family protein [Micrococcaceae bacterium]
MQKKFRQDIQFLRFVAITLVILNHLIGYRFTGGFIGVDVFFVISGYLIIGHIAHDIDKGVFSFTKFYLKRAWRLLPAAFVSLFTTFIVASFVMPQYLITNFKHDFLASWFYVQNFHLMNSGADYFSGNKTYQIYEHFWSLAVEEQFYLITPLALFLGYLLFKKQKQAFPIILIAATILSFGYAFIMHLNPSDADYFNTGGRIWEFAIGGLIHFVPSPKKWKITNQITVYVSYTVLIFCTFYITANNIFPGPCTIPPVVATALVIHQGFVNPNRAFEGWKPFQYIGEISYPIYLWHLPVFLLLPFFGLKFIIDSEDGLSYLGMLIAVVISLILAHITYQYVEKPLQKQRLATTLRPSFSVIILLLASTFVVVTFQAQLVVQNVRYDAGMASWSKKNANCNSGQTMATIEANCSPKVFETPVKPGTPVSIQDPLHKYGCNYKADAGSIRGSCKFANDDSHDILITGDSHVLQWGDAILALAKQQKQNVDIQITYACPFVDLTNIDTRFYDVEKQTSYDNTPACKAGDKTSMTFIKTKHPKHIIISNFSSNELLFPHSSTQPTGMTATSAERQRSSLIYMQRVQQRATELLLHSKNVTYIKDPPVNSNAVSSRCLVFNTRHPENCNYTPKNFTTNDIQGSTVDESVHNPGISLVNFDKYICGKQCHGSVNGIRTYYDSNHLNIDFVDTFQSQVEKQISNALGKQPNPFQAKAP